MGWPGMASTGRDTIMGGQGIPGMHTGWPLGAIGGGGGGTHIPGMPIIGGCGRPAGTTITLAGLFSRSFTRAMICSTSIRMVSWQVQVFLAQQHLPEQHLQSLAQEHLAEQHLQSFAQEHLLEQHLQSLAQQQEFLVLHLVAQQASQEAGPVLQAELHAVLAVDAGQQGAHGMVEHGIEPLQPPQELAAAQGTAQVPQALGPS